jgi:DNA polymerase III alpha subunit
LSTCLLDLDDRVITDTGAMIAKHELLVKLALNQEPFSHLATVKHNDIFDYHRLKKTQSQSRQWIPDDHIIGPAMETFDWNVPEQYQSIDVEDYCQTKLFAMGKDSDEYIDRLVMELIAVEDKQMTEFIQCLIWIIDTMRADNVVWGLGRGSSCASLIMFIIGVNKVDPVLYEIDMGEFYK